jgi:hypothetical protein
MKDTSILSARRAALTLAVAACAWGMAPGQAAAQAAPATVVLNVEGQGVGPQITGAMTSVVMAEIRSAPEYALVDRPRANLSDIALVIGCDAQAAECVASVGEQLGAGALVYGTARAEAGGTRIKIEIFDVASKRVVHRVQKVVPQQKDAVGATRAELARLFSSMRQAERSAKLTISSNVRGARVLLNDEPVGSTPFERDGIAPGTYKVTVARDGFVPWQMVAAISEGASLTLRAELKRDGVVVKDPTPKPDPDPKADPDPGKEDPGPLVVENPKDGGGGGRDTMRPSDQNDSLNWGGYGLMGVGGAALIGSGVAAFMMEGVEDDLQQRFEDRTLTESERVDLTNRGESLQTTHWVLLGVGGVAATAGLIWVIADAASGGETQGTTFMVAPTSGGVSAGASFRF